MAADSVLQENTFSVRRRYWRTAQERFIGSAAAEFVKEIEISHRNMEDSNLMSLFKYLDCWINSIKSFGNSNNNIPEFLMESNFEERSARGCQDKSNLAFTLSLS